MTSSPTAAGPSTPLGPEHMDPPVASKGAVWIWIAVPLLIILISLAVTVRSGFVLPG